MQQPNLLIPMCTLERRATYPAQQIYYAIHYIPELILYILRFDSKDTTFEFGHFMTISGHFFTNYNYFHKT